MKASLFGAISVVVLMLLMVLFRSKQTIFISCAAMAIASLHFSLINLLYELYKNKVTVFLYENVVIVTPNLCLFSMVMLEKSL
jgi:hypothetical protein